MLAKTISVNRLPRGLTHSLRGPLACFQLKFPVRRDVQRMRSYTVFSKLKKFAKPNLEEENNTEKIVVDFKNPESGLDKLLVRCDEDLGGFSTVHLDPVKEGNTSFARFHGEISLDLPEDRPDVIRLGYAMLRTKDLPPTFLGLGSPAFHDWSPYSQLTMRVRGDYRKYFINVQADTPYPTDLYQHRLFLRTPGEWENVTVSFANFILTNGGVIQQQQRLDTSAIRSVGIGLIDGQYGPYQLDIDWIKVHNGEELYDEQHLDSIESADNENLLQESPMGGAAPENDPPTDGKTPEGKTPGKRLSVDD